MKYIYLSLDSVLHPQLLGEEKSPTRPSKAKVCREEFTEQLISP